MSRLKNRICEIKIRKGIVEIVQFAIHSVEWNKKTNIAAEFNSYHQKAVEFSNYLSKLYHWRWIKIVFVVRMNESTYWKARRNSIKIVFKP